MSVALILRGLFATLSVIVVGVIGAFGFQLIEPFENAFTAPASLGWGDPGTTVVNFAAVGILGLLLVVTIWLISAPIRNDQRQQFRR